VGKLQHTHKQYTARKIAKHTGEVGRERDRGEGRGVAAGRAFDRTGVYGQSPNKSKHNLDPTNPPV